MTDGLTTMRRLPGLLVGLLLGLSPGAGSAQNSAAPLSVDEVQQLIVGNTVRGVVHARLFNIYYEAGGRVNISIQGRQSLSELDDGSWKIKDGNTLCQEFSDVFDGDERCYQWYKTGGQRYVMRNVDAFRVSDLTVWNIQQGNPLGF